MIKKVLLAFALLIALFVILVSMQPTKFRIERSAVINAPPETVFAQINDLHHWEKWSPWANLDSEMSQTYEGEAAGQGAIYTWSGNSDVGEGRMTITESRPAELVQLSLEFLRPMQATNTAEFLLVPDNDGTKVTWSMTGENGFMGKAFGLFMNLDKMLGAQFEQGLAQLKTVAEATP